MQTTFCVKKEFIYYVLKAILCIKHSRKKNQTKYFFNYGAAIKSYALIKQQQQLYSNAMRHCSLRVKSVS